MASMTDEPVPDQAELRQAVRNLLARQRADGRAAVPAVAAERIGEVRRKRAVEKASGEQGDEPSRFVVLREEDGHPLPSTSRPASAMPTDVRRELADDGVLPGDPLYRIVTKLADTVQAVADGSKALNEAVQAAAAEEVGKAVVRIGEVEERAVERLASALERSAEQEGRRLHWKAAGLAGLGLVAALTVGGGAGWLAGRSATHVVEGELAAAFQDGPDAARAWLKLWRQNNPVVALERCKGNAGFEQGGRRGCWVPLWLEPASSPR
jgi:hypothetical protein